MAKKESTVYLGGILISMKDGESFEGARARYNKRAMVTYRRKIESNFWKNHSGV